MSARFAILDTVDNCWMGENDEGTGPRTYPNETVARIAENLLRVQSMPPDRFARFARGTVPAPAGRYEVLPYHDDATVRKDEIPLHASCDEAVDALGWGRSVARGTAMTPPLSGTHP